ncbi:MAG: cobalt-precorrin-5B (C1)-methyltransferase [Actinomycetota bacterium]|nr:cobalt-precorrin-5B (C1)-methyltransferase [Actinomycetota bacterium]
MTSSVQGPRTGWTTGACATAATAAACTALLTGRFPDPVRITLPRGRHPSFPLALSHLVSNGRGPKNGRGPEDGPCAVAGVVKDAGDDPDITHGALIRATVRPGPPGGPVVFRAGPGVGVVTRPGLPLAVGEPAINPSPRAMIESAIAEITRQHGGTGSFVVEIAVEGGQDLALRTLNPRLGIVGGLSILGTTGVVIPYSCSAWIDAIRRGIDVARAGGSRHVAACTGRTSEAAAARVHGLPQQALLDMGDFAGATLKYLRRHPVPRLTIAGGPAKLCKLAQGHLDLHSARSAVDLPALARAVAGAGGTAGLVRDVAGATTVLQAREYCDGEGFPLGDLVAAGALEQALRVLRPTPPEVDVLVVGRGGDVVGTATNRTTTGR